jgi:hypothetical protein
MEQASKQQHAGGTRGNRQFNKVDFVSPHKKSKTSIKDERTTKIEIRLVHPRRSVMVKTIETYQLESERSKWAKDGWELFINN